MKNLLLAGAAALVLFTTPASASVADLVTSILTATHADFAAADADAKAHSDVLASQCWEGADAYLSKQTANGTGFVAPGAPKGVFSTFQAARDVAKAGLALKTQFSVTHKLPVELEQACGPLIVDSVDDVRTIGNAVGLGAFNLAIAGKPIF